MTLQCHQARAQDFEALGQLLELYQYDLSDVWTQDLDSKGRYGYDLTRHQKAERSRAYVAREGEQLIGFALTAPALVTMNEGLWMEQFFILKRYRRTGVGRALARHVLTSHPGPWEVGQMTGNAAATPFWRTVIRELTGHRFTEIQVTEGWWQGTVQQFQIPTL